MNIEHSATSDSNHVSNDPQPFPQGLVTVVRENAVDMPDLFQREVGTRSSSLMQSSGSMRQVNKATLADELWTA